MASKEDRHRAAWDWLMQNIDDVYHLLVNTGMPTEEARDCLPLGTVTRIQYLTDLRNLTDHAGNRLCTQAQFGWRQIFSQIVNSIRNYPYNDGSSSVATIDHWQFEALANSTLFRPVCYQLGKCPFKASMDRACSIRERVDAFAANGVPSSEWYQGDPFGEVPPINPAEWLLDPSAART
jgi:hypothetical protein